MSAESRSFAPFTEDDTTIDYHDLISSTLPRFESDPGPVLQAAGGELFDLLSLYERTAALSERDRSLLITNYECSEYVDARWDSALLAAIRKRSTENVRLLLAKGANPNGISLASQSSYALRFRRLFADERVDPTNTCVPVDPEDVAEVIPSELSPLTEDELSRREHTLAPFWGPPRDRALPLDLSQNGDSLHSLVTAAKTGLKEIVDLLFNAGADASFWSGAHTRQLPDPATSSSLCLSTPLHSAVGAGDMTMLRHMIEKCHLNPNARALTALEKAWTPVQKAVIDGQKAAFQYLLAQSSIDTNIVSPVYGVHIMHLAAARHDIDTQRMLEPIPAPTTSLGQTPLHVACLPLSDLHIQSDTPAIQQCIHDVRTLDACWVLWRPVRRLGGRISPSSPPAPTKTEDLPSQEQFVKHLVQSYGPVEIGTQDVYGNTALHYLAAVKTPNHGLLSWLRSQVGGEQVWKLKRNRWLFSAADLWHARDA